MFFDTNTATADVMPAVVMEPTSSEDVIQRDALLVSNYIQGNENAFVELWMRYERLVFNDIKRLLCNADDANEATDQVRSKVLQEIRTFDTTRPFAPWVRRVAHNFCVNEIIKNKKRPVTFVGGVTGPENEVETDIATEFRNTPDPSFSPYERAVAEEKARFIAQTIAKIKNPFREVLVCYELEHMSYDEIANSLNIPIGTVMSRLFKARRCFRVIYRRLTGQLGVPVEQIF